MFACRSWTYGGIFCESRSGEFSNSKPAKLFIMRVSLFTCSNDLYVQPFLLYNHVVTALAFIFVRTVKRPPVITGQPGSVTVFSVEDFAMNCEASGNPPPMLVNTHIQTK